MAYYAMLQSVGTCIGYFVGGSIGDYSLMLVFYIQIASVLFLGVISPIVSSGTPPDASWKPDASTTRRSTRWLPCSPP